MSEFNHENRLFILAIPRPRKFSPKTAIVRQKNFPGKIYTPNGFCIKEGQAMQDEDEPLSQELTTRQALDDEEDEEDFDTCLDIREHSQILKEVISENEASNAFIPQRRVKTYLSSEIPVRPCTEDCLHRDRCKDYNSGRVNDRDLCRPELRQIKKWQAAFRKGNLDLLKDDVGTVAGSMAVQVSRLLEAVIVDGVVVESEKVANGGYKYTEKVAHPALREAANIMKTLGIDLNSFLMTPKSQKDAPPQFQVNIGISADEVQARFAARYSQKLPEPVVEALPKPEVIPDE
jgi:hypothetical protein